MEDTLSHPDVTYSEKELLTGLLSGSRDKARLFFKAYGGIIKSAVRSVDIRSDAVDPDDLFTGAVENLLKNDMKAVRTFSGKCKFSTFLFTICHRYALSVVKYEHTRRTETFAENFHSDIFEDNSSFDSMQKVALSEAINQCDPDTQLFIRMMFIDQRSTEEIKNLFGWNSDNSVYSKKNKTIAKLKKSARKILLNRKNR